MSIKKDANAAARGDIPTVPFQTEADHLDYLLVVLFSAGVMAEERFDALALAHLNPFRLAGRLAALKRQMLDTQQAHRLTLRGRPYLCALRSAGVTDAHGRPCVVAWDAKTALDRLAAEAERGDPPKPKRPVYYD